MASNCFWNKTETFSNNQRKHCQELSWIITARWAKQGNKKKRKRNYQRQKRKTYLESPSCREENVLHISFLTQRHNRNSIADRCISGNGMFQKRISCSLLSPGFGGWHLCPVCMLKGLRSPAVNYCDAVLGFCTNQWLYLWVTQMFKHFPWSWIWVFREHMAR